MMTSANVMTFAVCARPPALLFDTIATSTESGPVWRNRLLPTMPVAPMIEIRVGDADPIGQTSCLDSVL